MQTQMYKWKRKNVKTGEDEDAMVQGALRPIQLWEYVFPEECLPEVLSMLDINTKEKRAELSKTKMKILRRALGKDVIEVPETIFVPTSRYVEMRGVGLYPIGIKKDIKTEGWGYEQEML